MQCYHIWAHVAAAETRTGGGSTDILDTSYWQYMIFDNQVWTRRCSPQAAGSFVVDAEGFGANLYPPHITTLEPNMS